jgi:hypothetical protein
MLLYKYRSLINDEQVERFKKIISTGKFWYANTTEVNDPFELRCSIDFNWDYQETTEAFALIEKQMNPNINFNDALEKVRHVFNKLSQNKIKERQWEIALNMWQTLAKATTMCCFAGDPTSILMWSHYASNHVGAVIEIEVPDHLIENHLFAIINKVDYSDKIPTFSPLELVDIATAFERDAFGKIFLRKANCWSYEQEYRLIQTNNFELKEVPSHESSLPDNCKIQRIIIGFSLPQEKRDMLKDFIRSQSKDIRIGYVLPSSDQYHSLKVVNEDQLY